jgi:pimeloyl-ACP methyl ester carboxylesterase
MRTILLAIFALTISRGAYAQDISGNWAGKVQLSNSKTLEFNFNFTKTEEGYRTEIDIPTNRVAGLKPQSTSFLDHHLIIDGSNLGIGYEGIFDPGNEKFTGKFSEGPNTIPLELERSEGKQMLVVNRPQEPARPLPYYEEEVSFENADAEVTLAGTFTRPIEAKKYPAVILITGSGPQDRDQTFLGHKTFLVLSDYLTRQGIAVLRYDDRGTAESTGNFSSSTTEDFADDVVAAVNYLKNREDVDAKKIGLIGHSEGGIIAPLVANKAKKDVDFLVILAGTGVSGAELSLWQAISMRGFPVPDEEAFEHSLRKGISIASSDQDVTVIKTELKAHYDETLAPILKTVIGSDEQVNQAIGGLIAGNTTPWTRYFYNYNPADEFAKIKIPVLSLNGTKDTQVPAKTHQEGIRQALKKAGNTKSQIIELEGLNHLFQEADTGKMDEYSQIEQTFSPEALTIISDWILEKVD